MKFKHVVLGYIAVWIAITIVVCAWEWAALSKYQANYTNDNFRKDILNEMKKNVEAEESTSQEEPTTQVPLVAFHINIDTTMSVEVDGLTANYLEKTEMKDSLYDDVSELTGQEYRKYTVTVEAKGRESIVVKNANGEVITPDGDDYVIGNYWYDDDLAKIATNKFEPYIRHINKLADMGSLLAVMQGSSKAYSAVKASQQSLKWMADAKSISFTREDVTNMQIFDENHFACDLDMDVSKISISSSGREIPVNETVSYRVLYEKVNGNWYIYSFITK